MMNTTFFKKVILVTVLFSLYLSTPLFAFTKQEVATFPQAAEQVNKTLPKMIDEVTRLEKVTFQNMAFIYNNTIVSMALEELDSQIFYDAMVKSLNSSACGQGQTKALLDGDLTLHYIYKGKNQNHIADVYVTKHDCASVAAAK